MPLDAIRRTRLHSWHGLVAPVWWAPRDSNPARRIKRTKALCAVLSGVFAGYGYAKSAKFWAQFQGVACRSLPTPCPTADDPVCREVENARKSTSAVSVRALELNISIGLHEFTRSEAPVSRGLCVL